MCLSVAFDVESSNFAVLFVCRIAIVSSKQQYRNTLQNHRLFLPWHPVCYHLLQRLFAKRRAHQQKMIFFKIGMEMMKRTSGGSLKTSERRFRSHFGVSAKICAHVWENLLDIATLPTAGAEKKHLLWGLMLIMLYATESVNASMAGGVDESTFRQLAWMFINEISSLEAQVVCLCLFCCLPSWSFYNQLKNTLLLHADCLGEPPTRRCWK